MTRTPWELVIGANVDADGVRFRVWAPGTRMANVVVSRDGTETLHELTAEDGGYHAGRVSALGAGARYQYRLDGKDFPDPVSRSQPDGVHGDSEVVDPDLFRWTDASWTGVGVRELVIYELHIGTFTPDGTFDSAINRLPELAELGVTAVEVMPIASFSGSRNWGYDGVQLFAPSAAYGGPEGFRRFVDAAHAQRLAVILDVVYNHFGPEGNYLPAITGGQFFTDRHKTPWGDAVNYDAPGSEAVRDFVIRNALYWAHEYHVDGLRLDATHAIVDDSAVHVLAEVGERLHALDPPRVLIAEDERNERRVVLPIERGGLGLDAVWADDLHHQLRRLVAGDREGYFASYTGSIADVVTTLRKGWFFEGQRAEHHGAGRGTSAEGLPPSAFVHCLQNHDQVGNRAMGDRLSHVIPMPVYRAVSTLLLLSPYTPLLWMGQEWAASTPFQYFTDHPEELGRLVTEGRRKEFQHFSAFADPDMRGRIPDPQAESTFTRSKLRWDERADDPHRGVLALYRTLLALRRDEPALREADRAHLSVTAIGDGALSMRRSSLTGREIVVVVNVGAELLFPLPAGRRWNLLLSTEEERFGGDGRTTLDSAAGRITMSGAGAVVLSADRETA